MFDMIEIAPGADRWRVCRLGCFDAGRIAGFVAGLDRDTLYVRFGRLMSGAAVEAHYRGLDWGRLGWGGVDVLGCESEAGLCALAETHCYLAGGCVQSEIALVVAPAWRGRGIGRRLLSGAVAASVRRGAARSTVVLGPGDAVLAELARGFGFVVAEEGDRAVLTHRGPGGGQ